MRIQSGFGLGSAQQGYGVANNAHQGYGLTEKDAASGNAPTGHGGLNHTWFRKHENRAGRWTSPDPYKGSCVIGDPQSWNRYSYVKNDPANFVDPSGLDICYFYMDGDIPRFRCYVQSLPYSGGLGGGSGGGGGSAKARSVNSKCDGEVCGGGGGGGVSGPATTNSQQNTPALDKDRVYKQVYDNCMRRKKNDRANARATGILTSAGAGCFSGGLAGAFTGASGGGLVGLVFGGGVGAVPAGAVGGALGGILGCGFGASAGILGQLTVGDAVRYLIRGDDHKECSQEAAYAVK